MKIIFFIFFSILSVQINYSQKTVKMNIEYGSKNEDISSLMTIQNIETEKISFESPELLGKYYEINLREYKKGKLIKSENLFDLALAEHLIIQTGFTSFKFFSKIEGDKMTLFVESESMMSSRSKVYKLKRGKGRSYLLKDFIGNEEFTNVSLNEEFPILAIITPIEKGNGVSSYCEVSQSDVSPDKYWEKFEIPHYFVISMKFK